MLLIAVMGGISTVTVAQAAGMQPQVLFNRGNYMLEENNYVGALETFLEIEKQGYAAGPLYFNIGMSYLYLDSLGMASYYFHKSARFRDTHHRADAGISFIEDQMRNRGTNIPGLPWNAFVDRLLFEIDHAEWVVRGLILLNIGVLMLLFGWRYKPGWHLVPGGSAAALAGIIIIVAGSLFYIMSSNHAMAIVVEDQVPMHPDPESVITPTGEHSAVIDAPDLAYEGYTVTLNRRISREHTGRVYIRLRNGVTGWVPESALRIL